MVLGWCGIISFTSQSHVLKTHHHMLTYITRISYLPPVLTVHLPFLTRCPVVHRSTLTTSPRMWPWGTWWISLLPPLTWPRRGSSLWWRKTPSVVSSGLSSTRSSWSTKPQQKSEQQGGGGGGGRFQTAVSWNDNWHKNYFFLLNLPNKLPMCKTAQEPKTFISLKIPKTQRAKKMHFQIQLKWNER